MKFLTLAFFVLSTSVFAAEMTILDVQAPEVSSVDSLAMKFRMDKTTGDGFADISVSREIPAPWTGGGWTSCTPYGGCIPQPMPRIPEVRVLFHESVAIEGLALHGNRVVYAAANGDIECGTIRNSSVLRIPTLYLNGNCRLAGALTTGRLVVTFKTK